MASRIGGLFAELKRRRVYRVTAGYVVVAAGVIGLAETAVPAEVWEGLRLPVLALTLLGLPIAAVLAWVVGARLRVSAPGATVPVVARKRARSIQRKGILVLPFGDVSPDPGDAYFSDGLTEEVITALSRLRELRVISRASTMVLKGTKEDIGTLGEKLRIRYVLTGSVRKANNELRIAAQLIDATDDSHLWAEQYDGLLDDVFSMLERVSRATVKALGLALTSQESERIGRRPTGTFRAYDCFLKARHEIYRFTRESLESGIHTLRQGLERFPDDPLLMAALGEAYFVRYDWGFAREDWVLERAEELARGALRVDPASAQGKKLLGHVERYRGSVTRACQHFLEAYHSDPADTGILLHSAMLLSEAGWADLAAHFYKRLLEIDPLTPFNFLMAGVGEVLRGRPEFGMRLIRAFEARASVVTVPMSSFMAWAFFLAGKRDEALRVIDSALGGDPDPAHDWLLRFIRHALRNERDAAVAIMGAEERAVAWGDADLPLIMAAFFAHLDLTDDALAWMARALERGLVNYPFFSEHGTFEKLRPNPRFQELSAAMKKAWKSSRIPSLV